MMNRTIHVLAGAFLIGTIVCTGCSKADDAKKSSAQLPASQLPDRFWLETAPPGAKPVAEVREKAKAGEKVVVAGVVGGTKKPFIDGVAAFTIVDASAKKCTPDECEAPWDYCCEPPDSLSKKMVTIEFRDGASPIRTSARGFHGLDHMKDVVVTGEVTRDEAGNVSLSATGIHVKP
jgi:hypothetical protein